jgi:hypothetical protein
MNKKESEFRNCTNCLHCKQSRVSYKKNIFAFCDTKAERKEHDLDYWNKKVVCKKFFDMRD